MKKTFIIITAFLLFINLHTVAQVQDVSFSQYFNFPVLQNPAFVGNSSATYRVGGIYRQQWKGIDAEFQTFGVAADLKIAKNLLNKCDFGIGFYAIDDHLGNNIIKHQEVGLSLAYHRPLDLQERHNLSFGINMNYTSSTINYDPLIFESQYRGFVLNKNLPTGESLENSQIRNLNIGIGLNYQLHINSKNEISLGASTLKILAPKQFFLANEESSDISQRWIGSGSFRHRLNEKIMLASSAQLISFQNATNFRIGFITEFTGFKNIDLQLDAGVFYHLKEAVTFYGGINYSNYSLAMSYDVTASLLNEVTNATEQNFSKPSAFEISFIMKGLNKSDKLKYAVPCRFF